MVLLFIIKNLSFTPMLSPYIVIVGRFKLLSLFIRKPPLSKIKQKMKVEIMSKETIKPSSPTPPHLRNFKLSLLDQLAAQVNGCSINFYRSNNNHQSPSQTSENLKKSLSETLTLFYPFAGRLVDNLIIDCNDNGALYFKNQTLMI